MAEPLSAAEFLAALKREGVKVVEVGDWRHHNRDQKGPWGPVNGVMVHHTVTSGTKDSVDICRNGYQALPGPLCHGVIDKAGVVHLVGYGRANHAGGGDPAVLARVVAEDYGDRPPAPTKGNLDGVDGNAHFFGFECVNLGDGKDPWPAAQLEAIERVGAAICRAYGWSAKSVIGHLEWSKDKIDPRGFGMPDMRDRIAARLSGKPQQQEEDPMAGMSNKDIAAAVWETDGVFGVPAAWRAGNPSNAEWKASSVLVNMGDLLRRVDAKVTAQGAAINELAKALAARDEAVDVDALVARISEAIERVTVHLDVPDTTA